jgi:uncharacterized protein (TIGR01777 family)
MKIVLPGGSGQVGGILSRALHKAGHEVIVLSRRGAATQDSPWRIEPWDGETIGAWAKELEGADAVINLAGRSVNCRYTTENRASILESRLRSTRAVAEAIARTRRPPRVWLQASTATIYAHRYDAPNDEKTGVLGGLEPGAPDTWRFSIDVATAWERAANEGATSRTRLVIMRSAMTMSPDRGGIFDTFLWLVRMGLGGRTGDGRQHVSWIHENDFVRAVLWLIDHDEMCGPVNIAAPNPIPNAQFMQLLRSAWGIPVGLPATAWMVEIGAILMRTESELALKSRRVTPGRLLESGFQFEFPEWSAAARELCQRWRSSSQRLARSSATMRSRSRA